MAISSRQAHGADQKAVLLKTATLSKLVKLALNQRAASIYVTPRCDGLT